MKRVRYSSEMPSKVRRPLDRYLRVLSRTSILVLFVMVTSGISFGAEQDVLENDTVQLIFDQHTGLFQVRSVPGNVVSLFDAGPAFEENGRMVSARDAARIEIHRQGFSNQIGAGEKLSVAYSFANNDVAELRYEISIYKNKPWLSITAYFPKGAYRLGDVNLIYGKLRVLDAFKTRLYVSSGEAGGNSGVWQLGLANWSSTQLSVFYDARAQAAIGMGFYSFRRASASIFSNYLTSNEIGVRAAAHYNNYQPREEPLETESLLLNFGRDPLKLLDGWARAAVDTIHPVFNRNIRQGMLNPWYIYGDEITEEDVLKQTALLKKSIFPDYGIDSVVLGEWQKQVREPGDSGNSLGFGEDREDRRLFPHGVQWIADQIVAAGLKPVYGFNYAFAASESSTATEHPSWMITADRSHMSFGFPIDYSNPEAQQWIHNLAHRATDLHAKWLWTDFNGGPSRGTLFDTTKVLEFEDIRDGLRAIRTGAGPDVIRHFFCCGPYFTAIGLVDRVRTGGDMAGLGDWAGLKARTRELAAMYMTQQRFWIVDSDPIFVGGAVDVRDAGATRIPPNPSFLDEIRMRLQLFAATGSFPTLGENLEDLDANRTHLLTLVLPTYGQAARPLDLFTHNTPEVFDLKVQTDWDHWHVLFLQNWTDHAKSYPIHFSDLDLDPTKSYLVFRFWDQQIVGEFSGSVTLPVGQREGESFAIREQPKHPWVLGTDMHLTQGGVELGKVRFDQSSGALTGTARRHPGDEGQVVLYVPAGYRVDSASGQFREELLPSGAHAVYLELRFDEATIPWAVTFGQ
jgi:hypothetical protein